MVFFYHNATLTVDGRPGAIGRRAVCIEELHYNSDGTMQFVEQTSEGTLHIHNLINSYIARA